MDKEQLIWAVAAIAIVGAMVASGATDTIQAAANMLYLDDTVNVTGDVYVYGGDTDDYIILDVESDKTYLKFIGDGEPWIESDQGNINMRLSPDVSGGTVGDARLFFLANDSKVAGGIGYEDGRNSIVIQANAVGAGSAQVIPISDNTIALGSASYRFSTLYSQTLNTGDIIFQNDIAMVECENDIGQIDICFVYGAPTENQIQKAALYNFDTFEDFQQSHLDENGEYDNIISEAQFLTYKGQVTTANGNPDFTFGRTVRMRLRDVKKALDRLDQLDGIKEEHNTQLGEIKVSMCTRGWTEHC